VSLLVTGKHTEIILNRGIGLHTILGITVDIAVGLVFDKSYVSFRDYDHVLKDKEA
jgi:tRNA A37 threonylcarbamoyltransferase TsaD